MNHVQDQLYESRRKKRIFVFSEYIEKIVQKYALGGIQVYKDIFFILNKIFKHSFWFFINK